MANDAISYYEPGQDLTAVATAAVTGKRFLMISGDRSTTSFSAGNVSVAPATAAGRICGVAAYDAAVGALTGVLRGSGRVVPVDCDNANIAAFAEVQVGTAGKAVTKSTGVAVGYVITSATANGVAQVCLY